MTSIQPGATASELSHHTSSAEYQEMMKSFSPDMRMLTPADIARAVLFAAQAPEHMNVAEMFVLPTEQA